MLYLYICSQRLCYHDACSFVTHLAEVGRMIGRNV